MIGRTEQLEQIMQAIASIGAGAGPNVLFVTGEAGIGKSTLLAAVRRECEALAVSPTVAITECSTPLAGQDIGEVESLQPWGEIMAGLVTSRPERRTETTKLVGDLALAWVKVIPVVGDVIDSIADSTKILKDHFNRRDQDSATTAASQQQIFQQYINFLAKLAERGPLVLMIDDVHWADTASTNLLFAAARQLHGRPVLFILAYRPDDAASSRGGEGHPLLHIRNELERYDLAVDIGVPRMTQDDVAALLSARYPGYVRNAPFESWLVRTSDGNALFISQFIETLEEDGLVDRTSGEAREGFESIRVPSSAQAVVKERIRRLSEEARELLRYASVEGDTFTSAVLARISEMPQLKLLQRLRLIEESHRIIRALGKQKVYARETSAFQFGHVLLHKSMYEDLGEEERELLHEAVLDVLKEEWETAREEGSNIEGIAARLAVHARVLGQHRFAAETLLEGASSAWSEYAAEETLRLLCDALASLDRVSGARDLVPAARLRSECLRLRSIVRRTSGRYDEALEDVRAARAAGEAAGDATITRRLGGDEATALRYKGEVEASEALARRTLAEAEAAEDHDLRCDMLVNVAHIYADRGEFSTAIEWYDRALAVAREKAYTEKTAKVLDNLGIVYDSLGEYDRAAECYRESLDTMRSLGDVPGEAQIRINLGVLDFNRGELAEARAGLESALEIFRRIGDLRNELTALINLGVVQFHHGEHEAALASYRYALELSHRMGDRRAEATALMNLGEVALAMSDFTGAREHFERAGALHNEVGNREGVAIAEINLSELHLHLDEPDVSRAHAERAVALGQALGSRFLELLGIGHVGLADAALAERVTGDAQSALREQATTAVTTCVIGLREIGSVYADSWEQHLARLTEGRAATATS
jgi:tetratricopeptide (TPR) repeat protein